MVVGQDLLGIVFDVEWDEANHSVAVFFDKRFGSFLGVHQGT